MAPVLASSGAPSTPARRTHPLKLRLASQRAHVHYDRSLNRTLATSGGDGGDDGRGGGSRGGGNGGSSGDSSNSKGPGQLTPLLLAAAWAVVSEVYSSWQYSESASRDACRTAELFQEPPSNTRQRQQQQQQQQEAAGAAAAPAVSIIVPALNEELGLRQTLQYLQDQLRPAAAEIIVVDGGSSDRTVDIARQCGVRVLRTGRGRARQMNAGAAAARGDILIFVHADSRPPRSLVDEVHRTLSRPSVVLGGFRPCIEHDGKPMLFFTANNTLKTYYGPLLLRPLSFFRGLRCLFGDQTLFCRAADFRSVGGYDSRLPIMEDADLCIRMHMAGPVSRPGRRGQVVQIMAVPTHTSGRRLASWGSLHATAVHVIIGLSWYCGATPEQLVQLYRRLYTDLYR